MASEGVSLIRKLADKSIYPMPKDAVYYTSGLIRTEQTFTLIYGEAPHEQLDDLKEMHFGRYELKTHNELKKDPEYISWVKDKSGLSAPTGGESVARFKARVAAGFRAVLDSNEKNSVIVSHGGVICVIMASYFGGAGENGDMFKWIPDPGHGYSVIFNDGRPAGYTSF